MLHTWSLAVEEQFYLLYPLLLGLLVRHRRVSLGAALTGLTEPVNENETFERIVYEGMRTIAV
jgi:peptidoglycan/LPS O-acetylase OafA/YrhL